MFGSVEGCCLDCWIKAFMVLSSGVDRPSYWLELIFMRLLRDICGEGLVAWLGGLLDLKENCIMELFYIDLVTR